MRFAPVALALVTTALAGCSAIPAGAPPPARRASGESGPRLAVGEVELSLAPDELPKGYRPDEVLDADLLRAELARWVESTEGVSSVRVARGRTAELRLQDAWDNREDLYLSVRLERFKTKFEGHNGWWVPNIVNWLMFMVPAWWVATEEYSLGFTAEVEVRSVDSNQVLHTASLPVSVSGTFDEFDRGWQFFGFVYPSNDAENWRLIAERLLPAARTQLGEQLSQELGEGFRRSMESEQVRQRKRKTLALVIGVSSYSDAVALPELPYAASDARALAAALTDEQGGSGLAPRQVTLLVGSDATRDRVSAALKELSERAQPGDQVLVYFAGYGSREADGTPVLLLNEGERAQQRLLLDELCGRLSDLRAEKLLVLDCGFDGQARSVKVSDARAEGDDAARLAGAMAGMVVLSTSPRSSLLAPEHLGAGMFTAHLVRGLRGDADVDENGRLGIDELFAVARRSTVAESAFFGGIQEPLASGLDGQRFSLAAPRRVAAGQQ